MQTGLHRALSKELKGRLKFADWRKTYKKHKL